MLPGIARNKKEDEGKNQKYIHEKMKEGQYRWPNYNPPEGDEEEEEVDDVPLVSGTVPSRFASASSFAFCLMYPRTYRFVTGYLHHSFSSPSCTILSLAPFFLLHHSFSCTILSLAPFFL
jgi:hypothetical protein